MRSDSTHPSLRSMRLRLGQGGRGLEMRFLVPPSPSRSAIHNPALYRSSLPNCANKTMYIRQICCRQPSCHPAGRWPFVRWLPRSALRDLLLPPCTWRRPFWSLIARSKSFSPQLKDPMSLSVDKPGRGICPDLKVGSGVLPCLHSNNPEPVS
jgi:hypothetical protein